MTFGFRAFAWNAFEAVGPDASSWLGGIVTCDVPTSPAAGVRWGLLLSKQGKIQAELLLTSAGPDQVTIAVRGGDAEGVRQVLDHHLVMEDAELGPTEARAWAIAVSPSESELGALARAGLEVWADPPLGTGLTLVRAPAGPADLAGELAAHGHELSESSWAEARVTFGLPLFGVDFGEADNPHQAALERRAVSWQKGCYLGQEVVFMQDARGKVKRRLVRLVASGGGSLPAGEHVSSSSGEDLGTVTTGGLGRALARVAAPHFEAGSQVRVGQELATVEALDAGRAGRLAPV